MLFELFKRGPRDLRPGRDVNGQQSNQVFWIPWSHLEGVHPMLVVQDAAQLEI